MHSENTIKSFSFKLFRITSFHLHLFNIETICLKNFPANDFTWVNSTRSPYLTVERKKCPFHIFKQVLQCSPMNHSPVSKISNNIPDDVRFHTARDKPELSLG